MVSITLASKLDINPYHGKKNFSQQSWRARVGPTVRGESVLALTDNTAVVAIVNSGTSKDP